jgi:hypothetical protein
MELWRAVGRRTGLEARRGCRGRNSQSGGGTAGATNGIAAATNGDRWAAGCRFRGRRDPGRLIEGGSLRLPTGPADAGQGIS